MTHRIHPLLKGMVVQSYSMRTLKSLFTKTKKGAHKKERIRDAWHVHKLFSCESSLKIKRLILIGFLGHDFQCLAPERMPD